MVLSKHTNLSHKKEDDIPEDILKCDECSEQFIDKWSLNNHTRDDHESKKDCKFFQQGRCSFSKQLCWNRHSERQSEKDTAPETEKKHKCYDCQTVFKTKNEMMTHRINVHRNKVKLCRDPENCSFTKCWYRHNSISTRDLNQELTNEPSNVNNVNNINQTKTNDQDFSKAPANPEPPLISQK